MKKEIMPVLVIICLLSINIAYGLEVMVDVKKSFSEGEMISFDYFLRSDIGEEVEFVPQIICPAAPIAPMQKITATIKPERPYFGSYSDQTVKEWFEPQTCVAQVRVLSPIQKTFSEEFRINTKPSFDFEINFNKKVFTMDEKISIDFDSEVKEPEITARLISPDNTTREISLPYKATPEQTGTYTLEVTVKKEGYKTAVIKEDFGVIEESPEIEYLENKPNNLVWLYVVIGALILTILYIILTKVYKKCH